MAFVFISCVCPVYGNDIEGITMQLRPNRSNATNGDTVFVICKVSNKSGSKLEDSTLTVTFPKEFHLLRTLPESNISTLQAVFSINALENGITETYKVWAKIDAPDALTGFTFSIDSVFAHSQEKVSSKCSIIMIAPNVYPDLNVELKETHRLNSSLDFNLKIEGGYPPYEYYIDWGDDSKNKGSLRQEGISELNHSYSLPGEYRVNAYVNDYLGKQSVIRKRLYIEPWGDQ
jgi:hypothetical protein